MADDYRQSPELENWPGMGFCKWCGGEIFYGPEHKKAGQRNTRRCWHRADPGDAPENECLFISAIAKGFPAMRIAVRARDHGVCAWCGIVDPKWEADHIVPLRSLDRDLPRQEILAFWCLDNLQTLCPEHHKEKNAREGRQRARMRRVAA